MSSTATPHSETPATSPPPSTPELGGASLPASSPNGAAPSQHPSSLPSVSSVDPAAFSRVDAANCTPDIDRVIEYLMKHESWGPVWEHLVATYVEIERFAQFQTSGSLLSPTEGRPSEVAAWMKRARKLVDFNIDDVDQFGENWLCWWRNNQSDDWSALNVTGPNGIRLFLLTLAWWGSTLDEADDDERVIVFVDALEEVRVVFDHVLLATSQESEAVEVDEPEVPASQSRKRRRGTVSSSSVKKAKKGGKK
ncbi:hypothetical protein K466DRAFT_607034 [Polyporus arcularius HHB13444]|uniref:Uncharacterized protein n=1 Tax=Polyporus arcularius HHB13444 TaxID=1314778 RepID=A0A5C3NKZ8_9APHY|nr:hypothetical protein K466DRAFT_607034 [Polyporus arcularius HHB13444]